MHYNFLKMCINTSKLMHFIGTYCIKYALVLECPLPIACRITTKLTRIWTSLNVVRTLLSFRLLSASESEKQQRYTCTLLRLSTTRYDGVDEYLVRVGRVVYAELQCSIAGHRWLTRFWLWAWQCCNTL